MPARAAKQQAKAAKQGERAKKAPAQAGGGPHLKATVGNRRAGMMTKGAKPAAVTRSTVFPAGAAPGSRIDLTAQRPRSAATRATWKPPTSPSVFGRTTSRAQTVAPSFGPPDLPVASARATRKASDASVNARPPTRAAAVNARPQASQAAVNARPQTAHAAVNARPQTRSAAVHARPQTAHAATDARPQTSQAAIDARPQTSQAAVNARPQASQAATQTPPAAARAERGRVLLALASRHVCKDVAADIDGVDTCGALGVIGRAGGSDWPDGATLWRNPDPLGDDVAVGDARAYCGRAGAAAPQGASFEAGPPVSARRPPPGGAWRELDACAIAAKLRRAGAAGSLKALSAHMGGKGFDARSYTSAVCKIRTAACAKA